MTPAPLTAPPPKKFIPAGFVVWAQFFPGEPEFTKGSKPRGSRADGVRYEAKAQEYLRKTLAPATEGSDSSQSLELLSSPWLVYKSGNREARDRFCQPDALLINSERKHITIVEIKLQHTAAAWWQVRQLYEPVLRRIYTNYSFSALEIVKWLDPSVAFPETFYYAKSPLDRGEDNESKSKFGVHIFDPRGRW